MSSSRVVSQNALKLMRTRPVQDNVNKRVLSINFNSHAATIHYKKNGNIYDLVHTKIPDEYHGQGLGTIFAERIFDHLIEKNKKIKLTCEFLQYFYSKNEDKYKNFVVDF